MRLFSLPPAALCLAAVLPEAHHHCSQAREVPRGGVERPRRKTPVEVSSALSLVPVVLAHARAVVAQAEGDRAGLAPREKARVRDDVPVEREADVVVVVEPGAVVEKVVLCVHNGLVDDLEAGPALHNAVPDNDLCQERKNINV